MEKEKIDRINELARKKKSIGITDTELAELEALRIEYLQAFRQNMAATLENVYIQNEDGSVEKLKRRDEIQKSPK